jgi:antitoxin component of MazEF toxin-antitoxin module
MVTEIKKKIRMVGESYGIILPKSWIENLHLWAGCELDMYATDTAIVLVPVEIFVDGNSLGQSIELFQKSKILDMEEKVLSEERKKLGNKEFTRTQIIRRINSADLGMSEEELKKGDQIYHLDSPYSNQKPREPCDPETMKLWEELHPEQVKREGLLTGLVMRKGKIDKEWLKTLSPEKLADLRKFWTEMLEQTKDVATQKGESQPK